MRTNEYTKQTGRFLAMAAVVCAAVFGCVSVPSASAYTYTSTVVSPVKIYGIPVLFGTLSWTNVAAANSSVAMEIRAGNTDTPDDGTWSVWTGVANGGSLAFLGMKSRAQTRVIFSYDATDPNAVPSVSDITVSTYSGEMISSVYDTRNARDKLTGIGWAATTPGSSHAYFQVRTSRNATEWSSWCGPDNGGVGCDATTYFSDASGGQTMDAEFSSRANDPFFNDDRYMQYRMIAVGDGTNNPTISGVTMSYDRAVETATVTSPVQDTGGVSIFSTIAWTETVPSDSAVAFSVRAGNVATPDGTWSAWASVVNGGTISAFTGNRYMQYQIAFSSYDVDDVPSVSDVTIPYYQYHTGTFSLLSSPYNSSSSANLLSRIGWNQTIPAGTAVKFQLRTAPDGADSPDWAQGSKWCGPATCAATSGDTDFASDFYTTASGQTTNSVHYDGSNDQWMQYAVWLSNENSGASPTLSNVTLTYVVNAPPIVQNVTRTVTDHKTVEISYEVKDADTTSGNLPNVITPSFEYWNGTQWTAIAPEALASGDTQNKSVNESSFATYTATWTPSLSNSALYLTDAKIRVTANDNEGANNIARAESTPFILDTKIPANPSLTIDASAQTDAPATASSLTLGVSDDSSVSMKISLASDFAGASWETFHADKTLRLETDPDIVYVKFKDQYGNETETVSTQTIETPTQTMTQDTSNMLMTPPEYRVFVGFKTVADPAGGFANYKLYRSEDGGGFTLLNSVTSRTNNFLTDSTVQENKLYAYKVKTTDQRGNVSFFSQQVTAKANGVQDFGEGGGGNDGDPPTIANVRITNTDTTTFTATWDTDELSNSTVEYGTSQGVYTKQTGIATFADGGGGAGAHSVTVTGLTPNTTYFFRVASADPQGNTARDDNAGNGYQTTTYPGPAIANVSVASSYNTQATVVWSTNISADTMIHYSEQKESGQLKNPVTISGSTVLTKNHAITLSGLAQGTDYYFRVSSTDSQGNVANDNNGGNYFQFRTTVDTDPPVLSNLQTPVVSNNEAVITFTTDEPANNKLFWRKKGDATSQETETTATYDRSHYIIVKNLLPETEYEYSFLVNDINRNETQSDLQTFKTLVDPEYDHPPIEKISDISDPPQILTDTKAVITFKTDQIANCTLEYGTASAVYDEIPTSEEKGNFDKQHSLRLAGLLFNTKYFYHLLCEDNLGNVVDSGEKTFTTRLKQVDSGSEVAESVPPSISGINVSDITGESAVVKWETDEVGNGQVQFGVTQEYENVAGELTVNSNPANYATSHTVILRGLIPATKYYYEALSSDTAGNIASSSQQTFTTASPSSISSIQVVSQKIGQATVTWKTSENTTSTVEYGKDESYGQKREDTALTQTHELTLNNLSQNTLYHFRVKGKDKNDVYYASSDSTFEPKSPPTLRDIRTDVQNDREVTLSFLTDALTDALVTYKNRDNDEDQKTEGNPALLQTHVLSLRSLAPGATYDATVTVKDDSGNQTTSDSFSFTLQKDTTPPRIEQIRTDSALAQNGKVQTIISFTTDEDASSSLTYKEGRSGEEKTVPVSSQRVKNHTAILTILKPGTIYAYRLSSIDASGNETITKEYYTITPQVKENVIELITKNFRDIFGWVQ